jgi:carboxylesterase type B
VPFGDIERGQPQFDKLVEDTGCSDAADKIDCLRSVPYDQLQSVITKAPNLLGYHSLKLPFGPTIDGKVLVRNPQVSLIKGLYAKVPIVSGACDDEATIFSFGSQNVTCVRLSFVHRCSLNIEVPTFCHLELTPSLKSFFEGTHSAFHNGNDTH